MRSSAHGCCLKGLKPLPLDTEDAALLWRSCVALSMLPEGVVFTDSPSSACCPCPGPLSVGLLGSLCAHHRSIMWACTISERSNGGAFLISPVTPQVTEAPPLTRSCHVTNKSSSGASIWQP